MNFLVTPAGRRTSGARLRFAISSSLIAALFFTVSLIGGPAVGSSSKDHKTLAALSARLSEPGGFFDSDNLISNETSYEHVLGKMREMGVSGGVYIGVGPDQNFTYISKIRPKLAIIIDIRRDNLLQHLMFKALFTQAHNRIEYLCLFFGRPFPKTKGWEQRGLKELVDYIDNTPPDQKLFDRTRAELMRSIQGFGFALTQSDVDTITKIQKAFFGSGLDIRYSSHYKPPRSIYPTFRELLLEQDLSNNVQNYLNSEDDFKFLKKLEEQDLLVPVVGDLSGPQALKAIGRYIAELKEHVSAFYVSNIEFYLSRQGTMDKFAENVKSLPIDDNSVMIRSYFNYSAPAHPQAVGGHFSTQLLERIHDLLRFCTEADCSNYNDLVTKYSIPLQ